MASQHTHPRAILTGAFLVLRTLSLRDFASGSPGFSIRLQCSLVVDSHFHFLFEPEILLLGLSGDSGGAASPLEVPVVALQQQLAIRSLGCHRRAASICTLVYFTLFQRRKYFNVQRPPFGLSVYFLRWVGTLYFLGLGGLNVLPHLPPLVQDTAR